MTNEMLYEELLKLDKKMERNLENLQELVSFMQDINRELAAERQKTELLKKKLFGNRFDTPAPVHG
ncbi:hypothetical protein D3C85_1857850 [compost metagenome]